MSHEFNGHAGRTGPSASKKWKANHNFSPHQQKQSASVGLRQDHSSFGACTSPTTTAACTQRGGPTTTAACTRRGLPCSGMSMEMTIPLQRLSIPSRHWQQVQQSPCQKFKWISCPERLGNPQAATKGNSCTQCTARSCSRTRPWRTVLQCEETKPFCHIKQCSQ